jgi:hypothetical protein
MDKKYLILYLLAGITLLGVMGYFKSGKKEFFYDDSNKEKIVITNNASVESLTMEEKIEKSEIILIGKVMHSLPSQWLAPNGKDVKNAIPKEIFLAGGLFTDSLISVEQVLKGSYNKPVIRVRSFIGETEKVRWSDSGQPIFKSDSRYFLFLKKDIGPSSKINSGDYMSINSNTAIYVIANNKAISVDDEWNLDELTVYIQNKLMEADTTIEPSATDEPLATELPTSAPEETATSAP